MARKQRHAATPTGEPIVPDATDVDAASVMIMPDGRAMQRTVMGFQPEVVERMRQGFICCKCYEALDSEFPDECPVCKFPMRERQREEFDKDFRGDIAFGPSTTLDEERAIMNDMRERDAHERAISLGIEIPKPTIIVPRGV